METRFISIYSEEVLDTVERLMADYDHCSIKMQCDALRPLKPKHSALHSSTVCMNGLLPKGMVIRNVRKTLREPSHKSHFMYDATENEFVEAHR